MFHHKQTLTFLVTGLCAFVMLPFAAALSPHTQPSMQFAYRQPGPAQQSTLYADGSTVTLRTESITRPLFAEDSSGATPAAFKAAMTKAHEDFLASPKIIIDSNSGRGLDIQFVVTSPPPGAQAALDAIASYIDGIFSDPIMVTINIGFESMDPGILGGTTSYYAGAVTWTNARAGLVNGMDSDDSIQSYLPTGSTIPVRYDINSATVTNEDRCYFTVADYRSTIGSVSGDCADMTINTDFSWDYDPSNGISSGCYCFRSVVAHETGHVLGFDSGADFRTNDIEALDVFRFQRTDGSYDYNPDTLTEFQSTPRLCWLDVNGDSDDDCNSDIISVEYRMSDGNPYQASHFSQDNVDGIMQPAFYEGETFYPTYYRTADVTMLDAIGYDYSVGLQYTLTVLIDPSSAGTVTKNPNQGGYTPGQTVQLTANAATGYAFDHWSGDASGTSNPVTITMTGNKTVTAHFGEAPPNIPDTPAGQSFGFNNVAYTYSSQTIDTNGDDIYYLWDWGDGTQSSWLGPYHSGVTIATAHTFTATGSFSIRIKAKDIYNKESGWSPALPVTMPLVYPGHHGLFYELLLRFLHRLFPY